MALSDPNATLLYLASLRSGIKVEEDMSSTGGVSGSGGDSDAARFLSGNHSSSYNPSLVLSLGKSILSFHSKSIQSELEKYALFEQLFTASIDCGDIQTALQFLEKIKMRFSSTHSIRLMRLDGMLAEAQGNVDEAVKIYESALKLDEANVFIWKRLVSLYWSDEKTRDIAIERLVLFLDHFMQDVEAWTELYSMYLNQGMLQQAAFCLEEIMILKPVSHLHYICYADLMRSLRRDSLALKYYCGAVDVTADTVRGWMGIFVVTHEILSGKKNYGSEDSQTSSGKGKNINNSVVPKGARKRRGDNDDDGDEDDCEAMASVDTLESLNKLSRERILELYSKRAGKNSTQMIVIEKWLNSKTK